MFTSSHRAKIFFVLALLITMVIGLLPTGAFAAVLRSTYIVQVQEGHSPEVRSAIAALGETPHDELTEVMDGFVLDLTDAEVTALQNNPFVIQVVADMPMQLMDTQSPTPSWGLDRIDQTALPMDSTYNYPTSAGEGVRVYVVDTGVMASNPDFAGRVLPGADMLGQGLEAADCHGHGTHVAGTAAGTKYGVAKKAWIVPVRVLSCSGSGSWSYFISAMDWIIANNPAGTPAVMSASLGGNYYSLVNTAVEKLYQAGITPIIAAGNSNADACTASPASAPNAITVGASDQNDARASFSNYGDCVDVFAPGVNITSDKASDPTAYAVMSGTSMATPHVSGLAALYLSGNKSASPAQVTTAIRNGGVAGAITNALSNNGNYLINNNFTRASVPVTPAPIYPPTGLSASQVTSTSATLSWVAPAVDPAVASTQPESYKVEYKLATATTWTAVTTASTSLALSGLVANSSYSVRVTSLAGTLSSTPTAELLFSTLGTPPDAPTNLIATAVYGNQIDIAWTKPVNSNGGVIGGYYIELLVNGVWTSYNNVGATYGSVRNLSPLTSYSIRVRAYNNYGIGAASNVLVASTSAVTPVTPTLITLTAVSGTTASFTWKASPQLDPAVAITYKVTLLSRQLSNLGAVLDTYTSTTNSYTITGLKRTTAYGMTVTALSGTSSSPASAQYIFTTGTTKASVPTSLSAVLVADGVSLRWLSPADNGGSTVTGYQIEKQNAVDSSWAIVGTVDGATYSYAVPAPARGKSDNYRISAINANGVGDPGAIKISTPAALPAAPTSLTITRGTANSTLAWVAPVDDGGAAVIGYTVWLSRDNGLTWSSVASTGLVNSVVVALPTKGSKYTYAVSARNAAGTGAKSNTVTDETTATVPSAPRSISFAYPTVNRLQMTWTAPLDTGGLAVTGYRLERQANDGSWSVLNEAKSLTFQIDRDLPGVLVTVRVSAINAVGASIPLIALWRTPYLQASNPQNFTAVDNGTVVLVNWAAPADLGGSSVSYYNIQISKDAGATWANMLTLNGTTLSYSVSRPAKGTTLSYRVIAQTAFGLSQPSNSVTISAPLTVPATPLARGLQFNVDGSMTFTWSLAADTGGTAITAVVIEKSIDGTNYAVVATPLPNATSIVLPRELPGVRAYFRVKAVNSVGASAYSGLNLFTPYTKASAPQDLNANDTTTSVALSWLAPTNLGGSAVSQYVVQYSRDNGATWAIMSYIAGSQLIATVARPAKGQTWGYRVYARTSFGDSEISNVANVSVAVTVSSAPLIRTIVLNSDVTVSATWTAPGDNGGTPITGYIVERSSDNVNFTAMDPTTALSATLPAGGPGTRHFVRVKAVNAAGFSAYSSVISIQVPYKVTSAPAPLTGSVIAGRVQLNWSVPTDLGGAVISLYQVEASANNGATWAIAANTSTNAVNLPLPPKGVTYIYRVAAKNIAGLSGYSNTVTVYSPTTVTSAPRLVSAISSGVGSFNLTFYAPSDLGGVPTYNYRVEVLVNNVWTALASGAGAPAVTVGLRTPSTTATYSYRVIATNSNGDSASSNFSYKG